MCARSFKHMLYTSPSKTLAKNMNGLQYSLFKEADYQEAFDLRYNHFLQEESLILRKGGHKCRTELLDTMGREMLSKGYSIKVTNTKNEKIVGLLMGSIVDRNTYKALDTIENHREKFGHVNGTMMYLFDLYGSPKVVFEHHPHANRYFEIRLVAVHKAYLGCKIAQHLLQTSTKTAQEEWGCNGALGMTASEVMRKALENVGFASYKELPLDRVFVNGKLLFPNSKHLKVNYVFKRI